MPPLAPDSIATYLSRFDPCFTFVRTKERDFSAYESYGFCTVIRLNDPIINTGCRINPLA